MRKLVSQFKVLVTIEPMSSRIALLVTGLKLLALIPIYRRTRNQEFLLGIGAVIIMLWSLPPFLMTGNVYYLSLGIGLPITATTCGTQLQANVHHKCGRLTYGRSI